MRCNEHGMTWNRHETLIKSNKINELNIEIEELKSRLSKMNDSHYEITEKY